MSNGDWKKRKLADRRKNDRRKDVESAKKWMGLERRVSDRRRIERRTSDRESQDNEKNQD